LFLWRQKVLSDNFFPKGTGICVLQGANTPFNGNVGILAEPTNLGRITGSVSVIFFGFGSEKVDYLFPTQVKVLPQSILTTPQEP
jgi:hypothetical protein